MRGDAIHQGAHGTVGWQVAKPSQCAQERLLGDMLSVFAATDVRNARLKTMW